MEYYVYRDPNTELVHWGIKGSDTELYHYGRKGMKWGQRIFQNKDGSLTLLGKRRRKKQLADARKKRQEMLEAKKKRQRDIESGKIKSKNMTNEELQARIERLKLEQTYNEVLANQKTNNNTRAQKFVNKFLDSTVEKVADNVAADLVSQTLKSIAASGINKAASSITKSDKEIVFANNKKK